MLKFYKKTQDFNEQVKIKVKLNKITNKRLVFKNNHADDLADKKVKLPSASAVSMSNKISIVREHRKTPAPIKVRFSQPNFCKEQTRHLTLNKKY